MGYTVTGDGYGKLREGKTLAELTEALEGICFSCEADENEDDNRTIILYCNGEWKRTEEKKIIKKLLTHLEELDILFDGEEHYFWRWVIEGDTLTYASMQLTPVPGSEKTYSL